MHPLGQVTPVMFSVPDALLHSACSFLKCSHLEVYNGFTPQQEIKLRNQKFCQRASTVAQRVMLLSTEPESQRHADSSSKYMDSGPVPYVI